jgi:hypothetical protein
MKPIRVPTTVQARTGPIDGSRVLERFMNPATEHSVQYRDGADRANISEDVFQMPMPLRGNAGPKATTDENEHKDN